jgi:hypothetical protein
MEGVGARRSCFAKATQDGVLDSAPMSIVAVLLALSLKAFRQSPAE